MAGNRLSSEKSPYLQQHAHNPVDWYPWGDDAFEAARRRDCPVLVSIGYSTCHWCHVMEHESFEDPVVADLMNRHFINIKVDREERPDVDQVFMTAVSAMTGSGGWPLNVFLTPQGEPFYGGTYYPPTSRGGMPSWRDLLMRIAELWADPDQRAALLTQGQQMLAALSDHAQLSASSLPADPAWIGNALEDFERAYEPRYGGFRPAPKFPMPVYHDLLLRIGRRTDGSRALTMSTDTLRSMARGGIYDHVGGGFSRYSTDNQWHVPHFEKMLYDNAQLIHVYTRAWQITGRGSFRRVAESTIRYVQRDLGHPEGGYYSAEDADSHPAFAKDTAGKPIKKEGAYYVWTTAELHDALGEADANLWGFRYGVDPGGNIRQDPHGEFGSGNLFYEAHPIPETAHQFKMGEPELCERLDRIRDRLLYVRGQRPRPIRDDKIITAWNGLMISALARAHQAFGDSGCLRDAQRAARFLRTNLYDVETGQLFRRWRQGERKERAIAQDYAFLVEGLLDLYESDFDLTWLKWATELCDQLQLRFFDPEDGGYFAAEGADPNLKLRMKEESDGVEPAAASVAVMNLLRLSDLNPDYAAAATKTLGAFGERMKTAPMSVPAMLCAFDASLQERLDVVIAGRPEAADTRALAGVLYRHPGIEHSLWLADGGAGQAWLAERMPFIKDMKPIQGCAAAYVCVRRACQTPVTDPEELRRLLS